MCRRVQCPKCSKATFAGCGMHIEQVLGDVPRDARCKCGEKKPDAPKGGEGQGLWKRLTGG